MTLLTVPAVILVTVAFAVVFNVRRALNHATQATADAGQTAHFEYVAQSD